MRGAAILGPFLTSGDNQKDHEISHPKNASFPETLLRIGTFQQDRENPVVNWIPGNPTSDVDVSRLNPVQERVSVVPPENVHFKRVHIFDLIRADHEHEGIRSSPQSGINGLL